MMKFKVAIYPSDEGVAVCVPSLPGCWSQGDTVADALVVLGCRDFDGFSVAFHEVRRVKLSSWMPSRVLASVLRTLYREGRPILDGLKDLLRHGGCRVLEFDHLRPSAPVVG